MVEVQEVEESREVTNMALILNNAQEEQLAKLIDLFTFDKLATRDEIIKVVRSLQNGLDSYPNWQIASASGSSVNFERISKINYVQVDTVNNLSVSIFDTLPTSGFAPGDIAIFRSVADSRLPKFTTGGNILTPGILSEIDDVAMFIYNGQWSGIFINRQDIVILNLDSEELTITTGQVSANKSKLDLIGEPSGETTAKSGVTINTATALDGGTIQYLVDKGQGQFQLGFITYTAGQSDNTIAINLASAINGNDGFTTDVPVAQTLSVYAPVGSGSSANVYTDSVVVDGLLNVSVTGMFGGGVDGVPQDTALDTINYSGGPQAVLLSNNGPSTIYKGTGNISGANFALRPGESTWAYYDGVNFNMVQPSATTDTVRLIIIDSDNVITGTPDTYTVADLLYDTVLSVEYTSTNAVTIILPELSGVYKSVRVVVADVNGNASVNNITLQAGGTDTIVGKSLIQSDGGTITLVKRDSGSWLGF